MIRHKVLCFQIWKDKRILYIYRVLVLSMYVKLHFSNFETLLSFIWMIFRNILLCFLKCVLFYNQTEWYLVYENFPKLLRSGLCFAPNKTFLIIWLPLYWVNISQVSCSLSCKFFKCRKSLFHLSITSIWYSPWYIGNI